MEGVNHVLTEKDMIAIAFNALTFAPTINTLSMEYVNVFQDFIESMDSAKTVLQTPIITRLIEVVFLIVLMLTKFIVLEFVYALMVI